MNRIAIAGLALTLFACAGETRAQEAPQFPQPQEEHKWLEQLVGDWETEAECFFAPGQDPIKCQGTENVAMLGGFWTIARSESQIMDMQVKGVLTLGYDPEKQHYVGTWIDSMNNHMWKYEGSLDESGKVLTLSTEGPSLVAQGKLANYKDVIEIKSKDERIFTSSMQGKDGAWTTIMTATYRRK